MNAVIVKNEEKSAKYFTPNEFTLGRAKSLFTKEPITIKWIDSMFPGEVLYDVGANVGMYSVWAGNRGIKVYAFEPEAGNYDILCRNLELNGLDADAYCMAITNKPEISRIYLSERTVGRSCHSFGASVGPTLKPRNGIPQGCVGFSIDHLVKMGLPSPNHIKIDVDGFEHKVIEGAKKTLKSASLKTVLVELNPAMKEHRAVIDYFKAKGWYLDQKQVEAASRPAGEWKGYAEHLFHKFAPVAQYTLDRIRQSTVEADPFPHMYVEDVFDEHIYSAIRQNLPESAGEVLQGYPERRISTPNTAFWNDLKNFMKSGALREVFEEKFGVTGKHQEVRLIQDKTGYSIGPHTDSPAKVLSALFYLPEDEALIDAGTSIYTHPTLTCDGNKHHGFEGFEKVKTAPFKPNSLLAFPKSDRSFHGVEKFNADGVRDILLYDVKVK